MKNRTLLLMFAVLLLCLSMPTGSFAQGCGTVMQPSYTVYDSFTYIVGGPVVPGAPNGANYTLHKTSYLSGSTNIAPGPGCQIPASTYHYPSIKSKVGGVVVGPVTGPHVYPTSYMSLSVPLDAGIIVGGVYPDGTDFSVLCSVVGNIFGSGAAGQAHGTTLNPQHVELAFTMSQSSGVGTYFATINGIPWYHVPMHSWCTAQTSPPDYNPAQVNTSNSIQGYALSGALCVRLASSGPWDICSFGASIDPALEPVAYPPAPFPCTHNQ